MFQLHQQLSILSSLFLLAKVVVALGAPLPSHSESTVSYVDKDAPYIVAASESSLNQSSRLELKLSIGDQQIERAVEALNKGDFSKGLELLHKGVENSPSNLLGHEYLAGFYGHEMGRNDIALEILWEGLPYGGGTKPSVSHFTCSCGNQGSGKQ